VRHDESDFERLRQKQEKRTANGQQARTSRFKLKLLNLIRIATTRNYLVKGILPRVGLAVVWGPPKCGKSFWVFDLVMHVALARKYRGRKVQSGPVVYLALEGGSGFANRIEAWRQRNLIEDADPAVPFYLLDVPLDLTKDVKELIAAIRNQLGGNPVVIVIDTLNRALVGDENKPEDMAKFIKACDLLRAAFDCLILVIHHCGIVANRPRGHTSLSGADDAQIAVERDKDGIIIARVEHMKDSEAGAVFASKLEPIELGSDDDGDPISSCVIAEAEAGTAGFKLSKTQGFALDALKKTIADKDDGIDVKADSELAKKGIPVGRRICHSESWRRRFYDTYPADKLDTKKKALLRATLELADAGLIELVSEYVWVK
jgi:hypothetical protein